MREFKSKIQWLSIKKLLKCIKLGLIRSTVISIENFMFSDRQTFLTAKSTKSISVKTQTNSIYLLERHVSA